MAQGSEYGGTEGLIQPLPHALTSAEKARLERATNPTDDVATADSQRIVEAGKRGVANPDGFSG